jgi:hypothetical protein
VPAGVQAVQVVSGSGFESNQAAFVLQPTLTAIAFAADPPMVTAQIQPPPAAGQPVTLLLNELTAGEGAAPPHQYSFGSAPALPGDATVRIPAPGIAKGKYLARVRVGNVASPLTVDTDPASLTFEQYVGPRLEVP